ncbi:MAG: aa3-type cytochrome c oxidase subunit IV [Alphaproteobacteria bacterium]|nr:aa3-type cytochrome c oxidase subunit IV [Alphaproteobacteria bacterium]
MAHHDHSHNATNVNLDPQQVQEAKDMWHGFTQLSKYSIIAIVGILLLMAIFLT